MKKIYLIYILMLQYKTYRMFFKTLTVLFFSAVPAHGYGAGDGEIFYEYGGDEVFVISGNGTHANPLISRGPEFEVKLFDLNEEGDLVKVEDSQAAYDQSKWTFKIQEENIGDYLKMRFENETVIIWMEDELSVCGSYVDLCIDESMYAKWNPGEDFLKPCVEAKYIVGPEDIDDFSKYIEDKSLVDVTLKKGDYYMKSPVTYGKGSKVVVHSSEDGAKIISSLDTLFDLDDGEYEFSNMEFESEGTIFRSKSQNVALKISDCKFKARSVLDFGEISSYNIDLQNNYFGSMYGPKYASMGYDGGGSEILSSFGNVSFFPFFTDAKMSSTSQILVMSGFNVALGKESVIEFETIPSPIAKQSLVVSRTFKLADKNMFSTCEQSVVDMERTMSVLGWDTEVCGEYPSSDLFDGGIVTLSVGNYYVTVNIERIIPDEVPVLKTALSEASKSTPERTKIASSVSDEVHLVPSVHENNFELSVRVPYKDDTYYESCPVTYSIDFSRPSIRNGELLVSPCANHNTYQVTDYEMRRPRRTEWATDSMLSNSRFSYRELKDGGVWNGTAYMKNLNGDRMIEYFTNDMALTQLQKCNSALMYKNEEDSGFHVHSCQIGKSGVPTESDPQCKNAKSYKKSCDVKYLSYFGSENMMVSSTEMMKPGEFKMKANDINLLPCEGKRSHRLRASFTLKSKRPIKIDYANPQTRKDSKQELILGENDHNFIYGSSPTKGDEWEYFFVATSQCYDMINSKGGTNPTFFSDEFKTFKVEARAQECSVSEDDLHLSICDENVDSSEYISISFFRKLWLNPRITSPEELVKSAKTTNVLTRNGIVTYDSEFAIGDEICMKTEILEPESRSLSLSLSKDLACKIDKSSKYYDMFIKNDKNTLDVGCDEDTWTKIATNEAQTTPIKSILKSTMKDCSKVDNSNCYKVCWNTHDVEHGSAIFLDLSGKLGLDNPEVFRYFLSTQPTGFSSENFFQDYKKVLTFHKAVVDTNEQVSGGGFSAREYRIVLISLISAIIFMTVITVSMCIKSNAQRIPRQIIVHREQREHLKINRAT